MQMSIGQRPVSPQAFDAEIERALDELELVGVSIALIDDGRIVYDRKLGLADTETREPLGPEAMFQVASLSKPVFAYLAMRLADRGVIDLDRPLHLYLPMPELEHDPRYHAISARMVLSHRTGFPNWRWFDPLPEGIEHGSMYMKAAPGTFTYSGEAYTWLASVLAHELRRTPLDFDQVFQQEVAEPLGLDHAAFVQTPHITRHAVVGHREGKPNPREWPRSFPEDTPQTFGAAGRLHTDAETYARFLVALMDGTGLSREAQQAMFTEVTQVPRDHSMYLTSGESGWTLGLAVKQMRAGRILTHGGSNGDFKSGFVIDPETKDGFVFVANSDRGDALNLWLEEHFFGGVVR